MTALEATPILHPLQPVAACFEVMADALDRVPDGPIPSADAEVLEVVVVEAAKIERQLGELRLRLARAAEAGRAEESDASSAADAWLARLTGTTAAVMHGGLWLARMLEERYPAVREAFARGGLGEEHARIIVRTGERIPRFVPDADRNEAVRALVAQTVEQQLSTKTLRRRARRMLDIVSRAAADQHEADLLQQEENHAGNETWMDLQDNGDGTWTGRFVIPEMQAQLPAAAHVDSGTDISVGEARRLACGAGIIPAVYGGVSLPLDVGRESRLHRKAHRIALSAIHDTCATEGCQRPFAWCETHHPHAWADGGRTDLDNGLPLCGWHHRRAHDKRYDLRFLASGEVRFRRRP